MRMVFCAGAVALLSSPNVLLANEFGYACTNKSMEVDGYIEPAAEGATTAFTDTHAMLCLDERNCIIFQYTLTESTGNWLYSALSGKVIRANALALDLTGSYLLTAAGGTPITVRGECFEVAKPSVQQFIDMAIKESE